MGDQQVSPILIPIPDLSNYFIDVSGNIYSTNRGNYLRLLRTRVHYGRSKSPYLRVKVGGKNALLHRIVASIHLGRQLSNVEQVNHLDGNTLNNSLHNLQVVSHRENVAHAVANKLYCSGEEWYKARKTSTTIPNGSTSK